MDSRLRGSKRGGAPPSQSSPVKGEEVRGEKRIEMKRMVLRLIGLAFVVVGLLVGCGPSADLTAIVEPTATIESTATVVPTASPFVSPPSSMLPAGEYGGHIVALARADVEHFDVHQDTSTTLAARGPGVAYSRMLRLKTGEDVVQPSLLLECDLCEGWRLDGLLTYEFRLRDNVRWQNVPPVNGRALSAQDVVFSYERQRTSGWPNSALMMAVSSVSAPDESTVRVNLRYWDTDFLLALADGRSKVVAPEPVIASGSLEPGPVVGTGPWVWLGTVEGDGSEFEANPDYFEEGLPFADRLTFKVIKDPEARFAAFITGQLDVFDAGAEELALLESRGFPSRTVVSKEGGLGLMLAMNAGRTPFDDVEVRRGGVQVAATWGVPGGDVDGRGGDWRGGAGGGGVVAFGTG